MLAYVTSTGVGLIVLVLAVFTFAIKVFAFADAALRPKAAYPAVGKQTKLIWLAILGVTLLVNLVVGSPLSFLNIIGDVAALVYLLDVRPAMRELGDGGAIFKRRRRPGNGPTGW